MPLQLTERWKTPVLVLGLGAISSALMFPRLLFWGDIISCLDSGRTTYPLKAYFAERVRAGELPLWFPYDGLGTPFLASALPGVFHPLTQLHLLLATGTALTFELLGCLALALASTFWLVRRLGGDRAGAAFAAVTVALSGPFISTLGNLPLLYGASGLPLWLGGVHQAVSGPSRARGFAIAAAGFAWATLGGDYHSAYLYGLLALPLLLATKGSRWRIFATVSGAGAAGLCVSAAQVLPTLEILTEVRRARGFPWSEASAWSTHPLRFAELFAGDLIRFVPARESGEPNLYSMMNPEGHTPWLPSLYLGALTALGILWAWRLGERENRRVFWALVGTAGGLVLLAAGRWAGLYRLFFELVPMWSSFRYPEKLVPLAVPFAAVTAALGFRAALLRPTQAGRLGLVFGGVASGLGLSLVAAAAGFARAGSLEWLYVDRLGWGLLRSGAVVLLPSAMLGFSLRPALVRLARLAPAALVALAIVDLSSINARALALCTGTPATLQTPSEFSRVLDRVAGTRPGRYRVSTDVQLRMGASSEVEALQGATYLGATAWDFQTLVPDYSSLQHLEPTTYYLPTASSRLHELSADGRRWAQEYAPMFDGAFLVSNLSQPPHGEVIDRFAEYDLVLSRLPHALPRVFLARPRFAANGEDARRALDSAEVKGGIEAVIEGGDPSSEAPQGPIGHAQWTQYLPEKVAVQAQLDKPGVLVLNDSFHPGWRATVDGVPRPILRANYLVRGVMLPAGPHEVVFSYPPTAGLKWGIVVSLVSLLTLVAIGARSGRPLQLAPTSTLSSP
jgi:hypothetical protein